jgi:hypothetical protein
VLVAGHAQEREAQQRYHDRADAEHDRGPRERRHLVAVAGAQRPHRRHRQHRHGPDDEHGGEHMQDVEQRLHGLDPT